MSLHVPEQQQKGMFAQAANVLLSLYLHNDLLCCHLRGRAPVPGEEQWYEEHITFKRQISSPPDRLNE